MTITSVQQAKKDEEKVNIFLDGAFWSSFTKDDLIRFKLYKGTELTPQEAEDLKKKSKISKVKLQALRHYSGVLKAERDIRTYLYKKNLEKDEIEEVIEYLHKHSIIDDERFANAFAESKLRQKKYSTNKIKAELKKKGITDDKIKKIEGLKVENLDENQLESIKKYIEKNPNLPQEKLIKRLLMRGFKYANVKEALGSLQ